MAAAVVSDFFNPSLCANSNHSIDGNVSLCQNEAKKTCVGCRLVLYCSRDCQRRHWCDHKKVCKSDLLKESYVPGWIQEGRLPTENQIVDEFGVDEHLWGTMPALDILNMKDNEGIDDIHRDISLLFAASGDIGNVVKSIIGLPEGYDGHLRVVINDFSFTVVARNIILLLTALVFEYEVAVPIMIHVWYSTLLPKCMVELLRKDILPHIEHVCLQIGDMPPESLQGNTFTFKNRSLRLVLQKEDWYELRGYFELPENFSPHDAQKIRDMVMLAPERVDYLDHYLNNQRADMRGATKKFQEDGILLPYGCSRKAFDTPNPTFFQTPKAQPIWPMKGDSDPHSGWAYSDYIKYATIAKNDTNGALFFYLQNTLLRFCRRLRDINIEFHVFNLDAVILYDYLDLSGHDSILFDRIELSNICDRGYVGPKAALRMADRLLKPKKENRKATVVMLFMNAINEIYHRDPNGRQRRANESTPLMRKFVPPTPRLLLTALEGEQAVISDPEMIRISSCYSMFGRFDEAFKEFLDQVNMKCVAKRFGMVARKKHTIVHPHPLRITATSTQEEYELLRGTIHTGVEQYMEFKRAY